MTPRRRLLLVAVTGGLVLVLSLVLFQMRSGPALRSDGVVPVVLVHGYGGDSASMAPIAERLDREGREVVAVDLPNGGTGDIVDSAAALAGVVDGTGAPQVDLIGYSAGGIVARAYLEHFDGIERARYVITVGSPHHGTSIAGDAAVSDPALCTDACLQMVPGSSLLEELNQPDETPPGPTFVTVWTAFDDTVKPPETALLEGAINVKVQAVCPSAHVGHGDLVRDPMVLGVIVQVLRGRLTARPDARSCDRMIALGS